MTDSLKELTQAILAFRDDREWSPFHTPRHLAAALAIEAAEVQELLLWKSDGEVGDFIKSADGRERLDEEVADVLIYALLLAATAGIDPAQAVVNKLRLNGAKYPVDRARGNAKKYTDFTE